MTEIVIKVDDRKYELLTKMAERGLTKHMLTLEQAVVNGKVLPKGHGELRDTTTIVDKLTDTDIYLTDEDWNEIGKALRSAEVLVEADITGHNTF
jgi:hypothetical protein